MTLGVNYLMHRELGLSTLSLGRTPWQSRGFLRGDGFGAHHAPCCALPQMPRAFPTLFSGRFLPLPAAGSTTGDAVRQPQQSTPRTRRCPTCRAPRAGPTPGSRDRATHGAWQGLAWLQGGDTGTRDTPSVNPSAFLPTAELGTDAASSPGSHPRAEPLEQPGLWYLAGGPPVGYLAPVPLVPYVPPLL